MISLPLIMIRGIRSCRVVRHPGSLINAHFHHGATRHASAPAPAVEKQLDERRRANAKAVGPAGPRRAGTQSFGSSPIAAIPRVQEASKRANIGWPTELKPLRRQHASQYLSLRVATRHTWHTYRLKYLGRPEDPLAEKVVTEHLAKSTQPLWYYATPSSVDDTKPVVVRTANKMANKAFRVALARAGYDAQGRKIPPVASDRTGTTQAPVTEGGSVAELYGTVRLVYHPKEIVRIQFSEVVDYLVSMIQGHLEPSIGRLAAADGHTMQLQQQQQQQQQRRSPKASSRRSKSEMPTSQS